MLTSQIVEEAPTIQGVKTIKYNQTKDIWTVVYMELLDAESNKDVIVIGGAASSDLIDSFQAVQHLAVDVFGLDEDSWGDIVVSGVKFPLSSADADTLSVTFGQESEIWGTNLSATFKISYKAKVKGTSIESLFQDLEIAAIKWIAKRQKEAESEPVQQSLLRLVEDAA